VNHNTLPYHPHALAVCVRGLLQEQWGNLMRSCPKHDAESGSHYRGERCRFAQDLIHLRERTLIRGTQRSAPTTPTRSPRATSACAGCPSR